MQVPVAVETQLQASVDAPSKETSMMIASPSCDFIEQLPEDLSHKPPVAENEIKLIKI